MASPSSRLPLASPARASTELRDRERSFNHVFLGFGRALHVGEPLRPVLDAFGQAPVDGEEAAKSPVHGAAQPRQGECFARSAERD
jgi:hypothetical protein